MPHLIEIALLLIILFLVGCIIGYFLRGLLVKDAPENKDAPAPSPAAAAPDKQTAAPTPVKARPKAPTKQAEVKPAVSKSAPAKRSVVKKTPAKSTKATSSSSSSAPKKRAATKSAAAKTPTKTAGNDGRPAALAAPRDGQKDNLKQIKGIGPKIENTLNDLGIFHFDQLAKWNRKTVGWVDESLSFKGRIDREEWISQAKALAKTSKS